MGRLRMIAAMLATVSILVAGLLVTVPQSGLPVILVFAIGSLILGGITPFEAADPSSRMRVVLACAAYTLCAIAAGVLAVVSGAPRLVPAIMLASTLPGMVLTIWAFRTRKRYKRRGWQNYFDN
ncbi:CHASE2 domain-containing sensor protein [Sphingomonas jinjuensis]|uniref:CHASE2 domain-containing sensor protein n=1 Tax=Sphingomonas jinjuensis TaxID=535907 RepID=A0A840FMX2_9SPHN|nr:hypothetical protein [Sphingomonas jinjuensis]MBB4154635.1 CHASE2 domain-containing sensor protein [Sphingomonas jinjuensis]